MGIEDSLRQADRIGPGASFPLHEDFQLSSAHSLHEDIVIAFTLIGIIDGEVRDGLVEDVALGTRGTPTCRACGLRQSPLP